MGTGDVVVAVVVVAITGGAVVAVVLDRRGDGAACRSQDYDSVDYQLHVAGVGGDCFDAHNLPAAAAAGSTYYLWDAELAAGAAYDAWCNQTDRMDHLGTWQLLLRKRPWGRESNNWLTHWSWNYAAVELDRECGNSSHYSHYYTGYYWATIRVWRPGELLGYRWMR